MTYIGATVPEPNGEGRGGVASTTFRQVDFCFCFLFMATCRLFHWRENRPCVVFFAFFLHFDMLWRND